MFFYEGQTCPVCGKPFAPHDDIVTCPECGAPHHRACWKSEGHCHFENLHGTDRRWDTEPQSERQTYNFCPKCGCENPFEFAEFCARCGASLTSEKGENPPPPVYERPQENVYTPPRGADVPFSAAFTDEYGGVPRDAEIEGVPVETVAQLVGPNSSYYLPRFYRMANGGSKVSWNWAAFWIPSNWLLYRKNLAAGLLLFVLDMVLTHINTWASNELIASAASAGSYEAMMEALTAALETPQGMWLYQVFTVATLAVASIHVLCGLFGTYFYMRRILKQAKALNGQPPSPYEQGFFKRGGVSFGLAVIPQLTSMFFSVILNFIAAFL